ncbi:angiopoietin-4-like [Drosophila bipectinata]|uniref:angiopoietin-4-like n=1 Tax=Drosophila bipectinata TaxID=42026 RepID=UPI001C893988|nr:fibrinogen alpha chain-like [Drosophila bipectinata]
MIFPVALLGAFILLPVTLGSEECHKNDTQLLKCHTDLQNERLEKYAKISKWQQDYSELLRQLMDEKDKYAELHSKQQEVDNLKALIHQQSEEIELLKDHIRELKEKSELATLTNKLSTDIDKFGEIVKAEGVLTNQQAHINNQTTPKTETIDFPDSCPRSQNETRVIREIKLPGSDPFKVLCYSNSNLGSRWMNVYAKEFISRKFNGTYEDFESGFGDINTYFEFFIGLNQLHRLTSGKPYEVLLLTNGNEKRCDNFVVGDRTEGYKVKTISNCTGDAWLAPKLGSKFSTFDRDEDGVPDHNVAKELGYGWWFDPDMSTLNVEFHYLIMFIRRRD